MLSKKPNKIIHFIMKKIIFILFLTMSTFSFSQNDEAFVDALVAQKMAELEMQANPEYFYRKEYCDGNSQAFTLRNGELCTSKNTYYAVYLFWREDENLRFQKFDNCGRFSPFTISASKQMARSLKEKEALKAEKIRPFASNKLNDATSENSAMQSCHKEYKFVFEGVTFEKSFKDIDLVEKSKKESKNANHNKSLALVKLEGEISELVRNFETAGKFFREN